MKRHSPNADCRHNAQDAGCSIHRPMSSPWSHVDTPALHRRRSPRTRGAVFTATVLVSLVTLAGVKRESPGQEKKLRLAVVVHSSNPLNNVSSNELRSF